MKCPYLSNASKKVCVRMLEHKLEDELTDFDIRHFCDGNPIYCYYFRLPALEAATKENLKPIETTEIPIDASTIKGIQEKPNSPYKLKINE
jgi:hypothetical protein